MKEFNRSPGENGSRYNHNSTGEKPMPASKNGQRPRVPLRGKVALIIAGLKGTEHSLAIGFAERGIDVALVYFGERHDRARRVKQDVEERDGRCVLINGDRAEDAEREAFARQVVATVLRTLGRLDIFINLRTGPSDLMVFSEEDTQGQRALRRHFFPHFAMMKAALHQIMQ